MDEAKDMNKNKLSRIIYNAGKLVIDIAKLCFASLVLGIIIKGEIPQSTLLVIGIIASTISSVVGIILVSNSEEK